MEFSGVLLSPKILLKLYIALILPHLTYYSSVWDPPMLSLDSTRLKKPILFYKNMFSFLEF